MRVVGLENVDMVPSHGVTTTDSSRGTRMSTSLLYQRFGVVGYHYVRQAFAAGIPSSASNSRANGSAAPTAAPPPSGPRAASSRSFRALAHRQAANGPGTEGAARLLPRLWQDPPSQNQLRRSQETLHPFVRTLCPGTVATHDHPGCRRPSAGQLGHHQGDSSHASPAEIRQAQAAQTQADRHR